MSVEPAGAPAPVPRHITAVILSHNAPRSLARCLDAVAAQTTPPDQVLVVDNASRPPATLPDGYRLPAHLVRSDVNTGPAGGYHLALAEFLESGTDHAWVLDDDMVPEPPCLERLWSVAAQGPDRAFVFPLSLQADGSAGFWPSWCGFLIARQIVLDVGLPRSELFWWAEDTEYLQWRIPEAGYPIQPVPDAIVHHVAVRQDRGVPLWKYYYEARNMLFVHLYVKRRVGRYPRNLAKLLARSLFREGGGRLRRASVIVRGLWDGARGCLGVRFPVEPLNERPPGNGS